MRAATALLAFCSLAAVAQTKVTPPSAPAVKPPAKPASPAEAKPAPPPEPVPPPAPLKTYENTSPDPLDVLMSAPRDTVFVETGREKRILRVLPARLKDGQWSLSVPPGARVEAWSRQALGALKTSAYAPAARMGAFPRIVVGTMVETATATGDNAVPVWQSAPGRFRAFPGNLIPVSVTVKNEGKVFWKKPRIRLFAPDSWRVWPEVADVLSPMRSKPRLDAKSASLVGLAPGMSGTATFSVRMPSNTPIGAKAPLFAFLRFEAGAQTVTVPNSVEITTQEPIERRYSMTEDGGKFVVRLINRFQPSPIGAASVEVRRPAGTEWVVKSPSPVRIAGDADAVATVRLSPPGDEMIAVPVVVTLGEERMGYTPTVYAVARYGAGAGTGNAAERGVKRMGDAPVPAEAGLCGAAGATETVVPFDVADRFALSDPNAFVSPTWVIVTLDGGTASRARLEYDAFGVDGPSVAGDVPVTPQIENTLTFLLPDARFAGSLPGKADFRLVFTGSPCVKRVVVSKWNPEKGR